MLFSLFVDQNVGNASTSMDFRTYYSIVLLTQGKTGCFYYRLHVKQAYEWENHCLTWTSHSRQIFRLMFIWFCSNKGCCSQKYNKTSHFDLTVCFQIWSFIHSTFHEIIISVFLDIQIENSSDCDNKVYTFVDFLVYCLISGKHKCKYY